MEYIERKPFNFMINEALKEYRSKIIKRFGPGYSYPIGTVFSASGQLNPFVFYLVSGVVKVYTENSEGTARLLGYQQKDTIFAIDSIRGSDRAVVSTESISRCQVIKIHSNDFKQFLLEEPQLCYDFLLYEQDVLRLMCYYAEIHSGATITSRIASFLMLYMQSEDYKNSQVVNMTQYNLASAVNASRIQIARITEKMQELGILKIGRKKIYILDEKELSKLGNNPRSNI